ncbi:unnamed protein product [Symbiodinium natans]|uniref:Pseudouridine synthase RsuA/RluA-like domain-containing protein n=1 Tax=Symbiodinium natans TaxID=878477 RepID=A0A812V1V9_9DINO|nr:unnamed protein product [Symbiodinium natans]
MAAAHVTDFTKDLADLVEERAAMIQNYVDEGRAVSRDELAKYVWSTAKKIYKLIHPSKSNQKRKSAWDSAKGMLKEIIDFELFHPDTFHGPGVRHVLEPKVLEVLQNYHYFVLTGEVRTRHFPPKLLGETDELLCVDKPVNFTCAYGGREPLPPVSGAKTPAQLLNSEKDAVQLHEYLALKFDYETALGTREFWAEVERKGLKTQPCQCGKCGICACMQAGCCIRLDKETSGVMVAAKTKNGFPEIRMQFKSEHSLEEGGTEKSYFALVRGQVQVPVKPMRPNEDWKHEPHESSEHGRRGRIEIAMLFDQAKGMASCWNDPKSGKGKAQQNGQAGKGWTDGGGDAAGKTPRRLYALTFYEPIAWFTNQDREQFTLLHVQLVTGRTHQIRFHCSAIGFPIVGDCQYGAPQRDRDWAKRVFLHSYETRFREPFTNRWFEATSPLPQDLGQLLCGLVLDRVKEGCRSFLSRRQHAALKAIFKQYDASTKLLRSRDAPVNAAKIVAETSEFPVQASQPGPSGHAGHAGHPDQPGQPADTSDQWWRGQSWGHENGKWSSPWAKKPSGKGQSQEDSDSDEAWGTWKPTKAATRPSNGVPEPEAKRPACRCLCGTASMGECLVLLHVATFR